MAAILKVDQILSSNGSKFDGSQLNNVGKVLQTVYGRNGLYYSTSSTAWTDIPNLYVSITPKSINSKFLITVNLGRATTTATNLDFVAVIRVLRNNSDDVSINGDADGSRIRGCMSVNGLAYNADHANGGWSAQGIDSPNTTETLIYKVQVVCQSSNYPFIMNGSPNNANTASSYHYRSQSNIIVQEIGA